MPNPSGLNAMGNAQAGSGCPAASSTLTIEARVSSGTIQVTVLKTRPTRVPKS